VTVVSFCATVSAWEIQQEFAGTSWSWNNVAGKRPSYCGKAYTRRKWHAVSGLIDNPSVVGRSSWRKAECGL
jgi:hypothetical protein